MRLHPTREGLHILSGSKRPDHPAFPRLGSDVRDDTFYVIDKTAKRVECLSTVDAQGSYLAWDTCGACLQYFTNCRCAQGLLHPDSIEWCIRKSIGWYDGEPIDFPVHMDEYKKVRRSGIVINRRPSAQEIAARKPKTHHAPVLDPETARESGRTKVNPRKFVRTKAGSSTKRITDLADIDQAASDIAKEVEAIFDAPPKKRTFRRAKK